MEIAWPLVCRWFCVASWRKIHWQWWDILLSCVEKKVKVNAGKSKVMILNGEEGLECELYMGRMQLEHVSEFNPFPNNFFVKNVSFSD